MGRSGKSYPAEYREPIIGLVRGGRKPDELAQEFEPCAETIRRWVVQADVDEGLRDGLTTEDREELTRLRRENRRLREEREILKKRGLVRVAAQEPRGNSVGYKERIERALKSA